MAESGDAIIDEFLQEYGEINEKMNVTKIKYLYREPPPAALCREVQKLFLGGDVCRHEQFEWVEGGWNSKELTLLERFLNAGTPAQEMELRGHPKRGPPKVVHYIPPKPDPDNPRPVPQPYLICPGGYKDAVVLIRPLEKESIPFYEVDPRITVEEVQKQIRNQNLSPAPYTTTLDSLLLLPHRSKMALPINHEISFVCQVYSTSEPWVSADPEDEICPFMRRFWWKPSR